MTLIFFLGITSASYLSGLSLILKFIGEVLTFCIYGDLFLPFATKVVFLSVFYIPFLLCMKKFERVLSAARQAKAL